MASTAACQKMALNVTLDCPLPRSSHILGLPITPSPPHEDKLQHPPTSFSLYPSSPSMTPSTFKTMFHGINRQLPFSKTGHPEQVTLANTPHLLADFTLRTHTTCNGQEPDVTTLMENSESTSMSSCFTSSNSDEEDEDVSSSSTSSLTQLPSLTQAGDAADLPEPLDSLATLAAALPIKRGLSRYFSGKSQSFSCLARVSSVADLAKPENPYVKRQRLATAGTRHHSSTGPIRKRSTNNTFHPFKCLPLPKEKEPPLQGTHAKPWHSKCFSAPEFQKTRL